MKLKESMTNVWTTISSEGCSIVKDFCESLLEGRPFDPARAAQVLQQIESFPQTAEWPLVAKPLVAKEIAGNLQETLYGMKKWLAHLSIIGDAYNDKLNDTDSAIIFETSAPNIFIATFDEASAVRVVIAAIRKQSRTSPL